MLHEVYTDQSRIRDIHDVVLRRPHDDYHRPLHPDRDQIETIQIVDGYCEKEPLARRIESLRQWKGKDCCTEECHSNVG